MYKINQVYQVTNQTVKRFDKSIVTLAEVRNTIDLHTVFYLSVKDDTITYYSASKGLNLNLMLLETPINGCTTWAELEATLTDMWVTSYKTKVPGFVAEGDFRNTVEGYYLFQKGNEWKVEYMDHREWDLRSIPLFKGRMFDLLVEGPENIDHKNCVVCTNGHMLLTEYIPASATENNKLLIKDGARHLWNTSKEFFPDVICFDFSKLGSTTQHPMYQFRDQQMGYDGTSDLRFTFDDLDLSQYTPLVVLAGALFFPHEISKVKNTISFDVKRANITDMLAKKMWNRYEYISGTTALESKLTPMQYLKETIWEDTCRDAFIILIKNNAVYTEVTFDYQFATHRLSQTRKDICGIVRQRSTGSILGYMDSQYHNGHLLYLGMSQRLWRTSELTSETVIATTEWPCLHTNFKYMDNFVGNDDDGVTTHHITTLDMFNLIS